MAQRAGVKVIDWEGVLQLLEPVNLPAGVDTTTIHHAFPNRGFTT